MESKREKEIMENKMRREIDRKRAEEIGEIQKMKRERE